MLVGQFILMHVIGLQKKKLNKHLLRISIVAIHKCLHVLLRSNIFPHLHIYYIFTII